MYILKHKDKEGVKQLFTLAFEKRFAEKDMTPRPSEEARSELNLQEEYSYID